MHIPQYDNDNQAIIDRNNERVPLCYFNIIKLRAGESFCYQLDDYETCLVPTTGSINVEVQGQVFHHIGQRNHLWQGNPEGAYIPVNCQATLTCVTDNVEVFVAGAKYTQTHEAFVIRESDIDPVQYGSDDTKTHRKIKHILGQNPPGKVGKLLVSELFTVGAGGWSGFPPHKHDTDRLPQESHHDEVYNFRFNPPHGFGAQFLTPADADYGPVYHIRNGSTVIVDQGYHPCVAAPGYEMYYFTVLAGQSQRPLHQYFHPDHAGQLETIPGIKDMIRKFK